MKCRRAFSAGVAGSRNKTGASAVRSFGEDRNQREPLVPVARDDFLENPAPFGDASADVRVTIAGRLHANWLPHDDCVAPPADSRDEKRIDWRLRDEREDKRTSRYFRFDVE